MRDDSRRAPYLAHLRSLPFVKEAHLRQGRDGGILELTTPRGRRTLHVEEKTSHLSLAIVGDLLARVSSPARGDILILAPYVSPEMGTRLASRGINFVDREGNGSVDLGGAYVAHVEGRRLRPHADAHGGLRAPGFRLVFALLVDQDLLNGSARRMAEAAGVSLGTASNVVRRLEHERLVVRTKSKRQLVRREDLVERWIAGYSETLRPQLFFGRFETQDHDLSSYEEAAAFALGLDVGRIVNVPERTVVSQFLAQARDENNRTHALLIRNGPRLWRDQPEVLFSRLAAFERALREAPSSAWVPADPLDARSPGRGRPVHGVLRLDRGTTLELSTEGKALIVRPAARGHKRRVEAQPRA